MSWISGKRGASSETGGVVGESNAELAVPAGGFRLASMAVSTKLSFLLAAVALALLGAFFCERSDILLSAIRSLNEKGRRDAVLTV